MPDQQTTRYAGVGVTTLAQLTHRAEDKGDDIAFLAIQDEVESRPAAEREAYRREWIRQMGERRRGR